MVFVATWFGVVLVGLKKRRDWMGNRFTQQVNFSLNLLQQNGDGKKTLLLRTLLEDSADRVWLNDYGVKQVQRAAQKTTPDQPFLRVEPARDMELVKHGVLNVLSERYSEAFLARAVGLDVRSNNFLYGLTWERYGNMRTQKLRVLIVKLADLEDLFGPRQECHAVEVAVESHRDRLKTLQRLYELHQSSDPEDKAMIGEVELGVLTPGK